MATAKKNNYIKEDLIWLEEKAAHIVDYVNTHPYNEIDDRKIDLETPKGIFEKVVASIETQQKAYRDALKDYALLLEAINILREREEAKIETRGKTEMSGQAEQWLKERKA